MQDNVLMVKAKRDNQYTMRMPADLRAALDRLADADGRSLADYLVRVLTAHVESVGKPAKKGGRRG